MTEVGQIHVGDMINVFRHGSLVMENLGDSSTQHSGSILYGTVQGAIGMKYSLKNSVKLNYIFHICIFCIFRYGHIFTARFLLIFIWSPTKSLSSHQICWTDWSWFLEEFHEWTKNWSHGGILNFLFHKLKFQCRKYVITFCPFFEIGFHRWRFNWNIFGLEQRQNGGSSFGNKYQT